VNLQRSREGQEGGPLDTISDADAMVASVRDPEAFEVVFARHVSAIHRYLHRRVGKDLADELAAQTFEIAFTRRTSFDPARGDAGPWLYGIAANLLRTHRRTERRQLLAFARSGVDPVAPDEFGPADERADAAVAFRGLAQRLARLRDDDRDALLLFAWAGLSYEQVAEALAVPVGTVRSRIARARRVLREPDGPTGQVGDGDR
jgi:RNA polymerase sigma-70 factor, ECF subfamily